MKNILKIIRISKPLHGIVAIIGLLIVTSSILELIPPILSKFIVDEIVLQLQTAEGNFQKLIYLILLTFILGLISQVITTATERLGDHFAGTLRKFLTEKFYDKILTFPQSYFTNIPPKHFYYSYLSLLQYSNCSTRRHSLPYLFVSLLLFNKTLGRERG